MIKRIYIGLLLICLLASCSYKEWVQGDVKILTLVKIDSIERRDGMGYRYLKGVLYWSNNEGLNVKTYDQWPTNHFLWETAPFIMTR